MYCTRRTLGTLGTLLLTSALLSCGGVTTPPPSAPSALHGKPLPKFKRRTVAGAQVDTESLRGKVVVVKFFAKYCKPCRKTLPAAEQLHRDREDASLIGVAEDEYQADVNEMIQQYGLSFPVIRDSGNVLAGRFRVGELPITFVADKRGIIRWVGGPNQGEDDLRQAVEALVNQGN